MRITILAIDGMDRAVTRDLLDCLPHIRLLYDARSSHLNLSSVFPPDTDPAWASFYTGMSPAQHGVIKFRNPLNIGPPPRAGLQDSFYKGNTFWDHASRLGKNCCICLPHNIYPGWTINGVMVTRVQENPTLDSPVVCTPQIMSLDDRTIRALNSGSSGLYRDRQFEHALQDMHEKFDAESELAFRLYERAPWDLFFAYFSTLDAVQHYFWRFHERTHPQYIKGHKFENLVREFYQRFDRLIGSFMQSISHDEALLIVSDHGHGRRPTKMLNLNEFLRARGYLAEEKASKARLKSQIKKTIRRVVSAYVSRFGLPPMAELISRLFPYFKRDLISAAGIDYVHSLAYVTEVPRMKNYNYCGVRINATATERDAIVTRLIDEVKSLRDPMTDRALVRWIERRENVYEGEYIETMPDIMLETDADYGISPEIHCELVEPGFMHRVQSGGHRRATPVFLIYNLKKETKEWLLAQKLGSEVSLMDVSLFIKSYFDKW